MSWVVRLRARFKGGSFQSESSLAPENGNRRAPVTVYETNVIDPNTDRARVVVGGMQPGREIAALGPANHRETAAAAWIGTDRSGDDRESESDLRAQRERILICANSGVGAHPEPHR